MADFIRWANGEGQEVNETLDYARLPEQVVRVNQATLMLLRVGGRPVLAEK
jgi:hypothetical protein